VTASLGAPESHKITRIMWRYLAPMLAGRVPTRTSLWRQALGLQETVLGKEHPETLRSMNNLAMVLSDRGKDEQAEEMLRQALRLRETVLGKEHPLTH